MPDESPPPIRETTARTFLKARTEMRVGDAAVELFVTHFTTMAEAVALTAAELAQQDERTTVLERDVDAAFNEFLQAGPQLLSPDAIHTTIGALSNQVLSQLIQLLRADLSPP